MTAKRFRVTDNTDNPFLCDWSVTDYADGGIVHHPMASENMANVMCELLNELNDECEFLEIENESLEDGAKKYAELYHKSLKENEQLKCALALNEVDYIIANGKKIDIPPYYEFEQRYDTVIHRREYDGYD